MNAIATLGRLLYGSALLILGVEHLINANFPVGLLPVPAGLPGRAGLVYLAGGILVIAGGCLLVRYRMWAVGLVVGGLFGLVVLAVHLPLLLSTPANGGEWTAFFECVALGGGALVIAGQGGALTQSGRPDFTRLGLWLFAIALVVFGVLHLVYAPFIATLIPGWIPAPLFWAYVVGVAFLSTALSVFINRQRPLATALLGLMFLLWVLLLHGPRVVASPQLEPEWTSLCVALAMSGSAFCVAGLTVPNRQTYLTLQ